MLSLADADGACCSSASLYVGAAVGSADGGPRAVSQEGRHAGTHRPGGDWVCGLRLRAVDIGLDADASFSARFSVGCAGSTAPAASKRRGQCKNCGGLLMLLNLDIDTEPDRRWMSIRLQDACCALRAAHMRCCLTSGVRYVPIAQEVICGAKQPTFRRRCM